MKLLTREIWNISKSIKNWNNPEFDEKKAYIAAIFSKIAYLHVSDYELENSKRAKIIPCEEYEKIIIQYNQTGMKSNIAEVLKDLDLEDYFVIENSLVIVVVVKIMNILFISLRGTEDLYDLYTDLRIIKKSSINIHNSGMLFHSGFLDAVEDCMDEVRSEILSKYGKNKTIYITGHSLGGAMASILHTFWSQHQGMLMLKKGVGTNSCYTFGMPRYGNEIAVNCLKNAYHFDNTDDLVPKIPWKIFGYKDNKNKYFLTPDTHSIMQKILYIVITIGISPFLAIASSSIYMLKQHSIDSYISRIKDRVNKLKRNKS